MIQNTALRQQVKIGAMDSKITILKRGAETVNDLGEVTGIVTTSVQVWAHVAYGENNEDALLYKQTIIEAPEFYIRYTSINEKDQISYNSKSYDIIAIEPLGRMMYLKIKTKYVK